MKVIIFALGVIIGSFLNVCIYRIPQGESINFPGSHCSRCFHKLGIKDLVPIFSWIFLKRKCRYCKEKISYQYPIVEFINGILYLLVFIRFGFTIDSIKFMVLSSILLVIGVIDFKTQDVYDSTIIFGMICGIVFIILDLLIAKDINIFTLILGVIIPSAILSIFAYFNAMGWGDVEIIAIIGLFLDLDLNLLSIFLAIVIGGIVASYFIISKKKERGGTIAFGPCIAVSAYICMMFGTNILNWYLSII